MQNPKDTNFKFTYKNSFWILVVFLIAKAFLGDLFDFGSDADEVVLKRALPQGDWLYITRYGAMATDVDTLRFFISKPLEGDDSEVLHKLNKESEFLITDSSLENVAIHDTPNGVGITVKGAVYRYFSKEYVTEGDDLRSYRITLTQEDATPRN
ncbi:hypothetical protein [Pseudomonas syringae group genomosp. 7]|uniref:hypothetical protein n=1 Tax=Pseudomonas syringae group genomosp. 7 TaxID=251699 RepID=UPI000F00D76B|nr:hypothetical protein [Pseudomonas syringae group genomosp. 7]RMR01961.1 Prophage PssSM-03, Orf3 [Pseudomonas syringae pv. helianthi]